MVPNIKGSSPEVASKLLNSLGLKVQFIGSGIALRTKHRRHRS